MPSARKVIFVLAALLAVNALLPRPVSFALGTVLEPVVRTLTVPARPVMRMLGAARATPDNDPLADFDEQRLRYDHQLALAELDRLRQQNRSLKQLIDEIALSRDLLAQRGLADLRQVSARVNPGGQGGVLSIAAGSRDGVAPGQAVLHQLHVVGRVVEPVGPTTANVALVTELRIPLSVRIVAPPGESPPGSLVPARALAAQVALSDAGDAFVTDTLPRSDDVRVGDLVRLADELTLVDAQGCQLGVVSAVEPLPSNPLALWRVTITPAIDLTRLGRVTVLVNEDETRTTQSDANNNAGATP